MPPAKKATNKKKAESIMPDFSSAEDHAFRSSSLLEAEEYEDAALEAERALYCLPLMARAALTRGQALLHPALTKMVEGGEVPTPELLAEIGRAFKLSAMLDPECQETKDGIMSLQKLVADLPQPAAPTSIVIGAPSAASTHDVIIVGAGAAGVGTALMLTKTFGLDASRVLLLERGEGVGDTFRRWPEEMRFISPSFNQQGWTSSFDLNSIAHGTSPAYSLHSEHPSGNEYADYLSALATAAELNVRTHTEVVSVQPVGRKGGSPLFAVAVRSKPSAGGDGHASRKPAKATERLAARYVVWAAGEFGYPREECMKGSELCRHNSRVRSWAGLPGDDFVVIGGYESGADAAINLARLEESDRPRIDCHMECSYARPVDRARTLHRRTAARGDRAGLLSAAEADVAAARQAGREGGNRRLQCCRKLEGGRASATDGAAAQAVGGRRCRRHPSKCGRRGERGDRSHVTAARTLHRL